MKPILAQLGNNALNFLLPPRCLACGVLIQQHGNLCSGCWQTLSFIHNPICQPCGAPLLYDGYQRRCGDCHAARLFTYGRAPLLYNGAARKLILQFKHHDQPALATLLATMMHQAAADIWPAFDALMPVPIHWQRRIRRRYNQAALLTFALKQRSNTPVLLRHLKRVRATPTQQGRTREERQVNLHQAFALTKYGATAVTGKHIALVDDVWTTGTTFNACAEVLLEAGACAVSYLAAARVLRHEIP